MLNKQLIKYMAVGATATLVDTAVFGVLVYYFEVYYRYALCISFTFGVLINFYLCDRYIFNRGHMPYWKACIRHYGASLVGFMLSQLGMLVLVSLMESPYFIINRIAVAGCTFIINFFLIRFFVFK